MVTQRHTKYSNELSAIISRLGHATNAELAHELRKIYPDVSDTTVHRITTRLLERGSIGEAPSLSDGTKRFDANLIAHDHFICGGCGGTRDIDVASLLLTTIETAIGNCKITGRLVINGTCHKCA